MAYVNEVSTPASQNLGLWTSDLKQLNAHTSET